MVLLEIVLLPRVCSSAGTEGSWEMQGDGPTEAFDGSGQLPGRSIAPARAGLPGKSLLSNYLHKLGRQDVSPVRLRMVWYD